MLGDNFFEILFDFGIQKAIWKKKKKTNTASKGEKWIQRSSHVEEIWFREWFVKFVGLK